MRLRFLLAALLFGAAPAAADEFVRHIDTANGFVLAYPASWEVVPGWPEVIPGSSKFVVAEPALSGREVCSVSLAPNVLLAKVEQLALLSTGAYERSLQPSYPGARVIEKGPTSVSGLPAFYAVFRAPYVSMGETSDYTFVEVETWWKGTAYLALCSTETDRFDEYRTLFVAILSSFMVTDR